MDFTWIVNHNSWMHIQEMIATHQENEKKGASVSTCFNAKHVNIYFGNYTPMKKTKQNVLNMCNYNPMKKKRLNVLFVLKDLRFLFHGDYTDTSPACRMCLVENMIIPMVSA